MPTYEYSCQKCEQTFEAFQSMKDAPYRVCPKELCRLAEWGQGPVKRLIGTGAGIIFKGSGFYITDYRSAGYKEAAKKESGGDNGAKGGSNGSSKPAESKPAGSTGPSTSGSGGAPSNS